MYETMVFTNFGNSQHRIMILERRGNSKENADFPSLLIGDYFQAADQVRTIQILLVLLS